ncbi:cell division protein FtsQ/DivIB [uncultured Lamprocystis sp.]|uniref:cell division protein FtsQ/DivIB n=1 Tax=uncultured Lamprocystis sp. TaxID=543132 RepID=UPI0025E08A55|nr:cell division protein FtsQ/DivIB [uncultured Lamprocystis sp.]
MSESVAAILPNLQEPTPPATRPTRLRALTGVLLLAVMAGGVWAFGYWEPRLLPVRMIEVQGELHHHSSQQLRETLVKRLNGGFLTADLADLKRAAEELAWVGGASIRRVWPDRLQVRVNEHKPVARWKGDGLVTADGVVFRPSTGTIPAGLPMLEGDEQRAPELVQRYLQWRDQLMLAGHLIDTLTVDARGAWRVGLVSRARLELGNSAIEERLARFIGAAPQLDAAGRAEVVDLRYSNGFAVRWARQAALETPTETPVQTKTPSRQKSQAKARVQPKGQQRAKSQPKPAARAKAQTPTAPKARAPTAEPKAGAVKPRSGTTTKPRVSTPTQPAARAATRTASPALTQVGPARPGATPQERTGKRG